METQGEQADSNPVWTYVNRHGVTMWGYQELPKNMRSICDSLDHNVMQVIHQPPVTLRAIDWVMTNMSEKLALTVRGTRVSDVFPVNIGNEYRDMLHIYGKRHFDMFKRTGGTPLVYFKADAEACTEACPETETRTTTIAQINYFAWAFRAGVMKYITEHADEITSDMMETTRRLKQVRKSRDVVGKRHKITPTIRSHISITRGRIMTKFV